MNCRNICESIDNFHKECIDFLHYHKEVEIIDIDCDDNFALKFQRDYVSKNMPVVIDRGCANFPAISKWNRKYFRESLGNKDVVVAVTPNGFADGIANHNFEDVFVLPEEQTMKFNAFLDHIENPVQNCNLTEEWPEIACDVDEDIKWASDAFNKLPDAVNFWMGDERAITSMHKDPYENMYCVIDGCKEFYLIPPTDLPYVPYRQYPSGTFCDVTPDGYKVSLCSGNDDNIRWVAVDPSQPNYDTYPQFRKANIYRVKVKKGQCLYLPSLWFHYVRQSQGCVAVNYWYDMDYDIKYCYYKLLESLCQN